MKKPIFITISCLLVISAAIAFWFFPGKPAGGNEGWNRGDSTGFINLPAGVVGENLIAALERNGFERLENKSFDAIVPREQAAISYSGLVALRDTTVERPNEFFVGVGPSNVIYYHESHDGSIKSGAAWKNNLVKRINRVEMIASNPR